MKKQDRNPVVSIMLATIGCYKSSVVSCVVISLGLLTVTYLLGYASQFAWEISIVSFVQSWDSYWVDTLMQAFSPSHLLVTAPLLVIAIITLFLKRLWKEGWVLIAATTLGLFTVWTLKSLISRPRPTEDLVHVMEQASGYSFPSGHVTHYVIFLGTLTFIASEKINSEFLRYFIKIAVLLVLVCIGLSRIYLGAHWPSDVLGGYLLGTLVTVITTCVWRYSSKIPSPCNNS